MAPNSLALLSTFIGLGGCSLLKPLPEGFNPVSSWAWMSYDVPDFRVIPGRFNRTIYQAPWDAQTENATWTSLNQQLNKTDFIAYDEAFFNLIGPNAKITQVQKLSNQNHEGPCLTPDGELFFAEWGPPGGDKGVHTSQYLLDTKTNVLRNITTDPPSVNHHGCRLGRDGKLYVVNDGSKDTNAELAMIDPKTWKRTSLVDHFYEEPLGGLNDVDIDLEGNFYFTADRSGYTRGITPYAPPERPRAFFVNGTNYRPKEIQAFSELTGGPNGITVSPDGKTLYITQSGTSLIPPENREYYDRQLTAYDFATRQDGSKVPVLINDRSLNTEVSWYYDGIRASKPGYLFGAARETVDVIDPVSGITIGAIRMPSPNLAVNLVFDKHGIWIVGFGGVFHVSDVAAELAPY